MRSALGAGVLLAAVLAAPALAAESPAAPIPAGWNDMIEGLRALPQRMLARLPEDQRNDPQVQQEVARLALEGIASQAIDTIGSDGDHPVFLPSIGQVLNVGQPNADTIYRRASITPGGVYRLRGVRGSYRIAVIAEVGPRPKPEPGKPLNLGPQPEVHYITRLPVDARGRYDVILSPTRPAGWKGEWWKLGPTTNLLMVRLVSSNWSKEVAPTISIERLDAPAPRRRPDAAELEARLRALPRAVEFIAPLFVDHVQQLRNEGYVNKLKVFDVSALGGLKGQFYYEGAYDLADDEALVISAKAPARCAYRSILLTNQIYETTDWVNNQSSLNDAQAPVDRDGVLRIVVSAKDPGTPNWLDTAGYSKGVVQGRWTDCDAQPVPTVERVKLADVRAHLPPETPRITPEQRDRIIRERRAAQQERPLW